MSSEVLKKEKKANLELLRCIAMMMVVVLHFLGKGELLGNLEAGELSTVGLAAWLVEAFCIVAVNVYMMISGYFLSESSFKWSRLVKLWLQVWIYSVGIGLLAVVAGILPAEEFNTYYLLHLLFPVSMEHYWFITAYVFLYLILPLVTLALKHLSKRQLEVVLAVLLLVFSLGKSVLPVRLATDAKGYDCIWYLCVFLTAAYIRKYGCPFLNKKWKAVCLYLVACLLTFGEMFCLHRIYLATGSLELILKISYEYNHILPFLAALGLFMTFVMTDVSGLMGKVATRLGPYTLGVYLLHENLGVRNVWPRWLGADKITGVGSLLLHVLTAAVIVFAAGILADWLRSLVMGGLHKLLRKVAAYRKLVAKLETNYDGI